MAGPSGPRSIPSSPRWPVASAARKNSGTPSGTVMAIAWLTDALSTPRRVQGADGVHHVIVGGQVVLDHGQHTGAFPGRVLRAGRRP